MSSRITKERAYRLTAFKVRAKRFNFTVKPWSFQEKIKLSTDTETNDSLSQIYTSTEFKTQPTIDPCIFI